MKFLGELNVGFVRGVALHQMFLTAQEANCQHYWVLITLIFIQV